VNHHRTNLTLRSLIWLGALSWWVYLRKPVGWIFPSNRPGLSLVVGVVLTAAGSVVYVWAARMLASGTRTALAPPSELLVRGPYRYVRNPLYLGAAAVFVGVSTLLAPWRGRDLLAAGVVALLAHIWVVRKEELRTRQRLGSPYDEYCARLPRWIPRLTRVQPNRNVDLSNSEGVP